MTKEEELRVIKKTQLYYSLVLSKAASEALGQGKRELYIYLKAISASLDKVSADRVYGYGKGAVTQQIDQFISTLFDGEIK